MENFGDIEQTDDIAVFITNRLGLVGHEKDSLNDGTLSRPLAGGLPSLLWYHE
jgi:hypothetical protein